MSNKPKPTGKPNSLARYRSEVKGTPFVLWLDDDEKLEIPRPSTDQMMEAEEAFRSGTSRDVVRAFCGDLLADRLLDAVGKEDVQILHSIITDMRAHFGLGE